MAVPKIKLKRSAEASVMAARPDGHGEDGLGDDQGRENLDDDDDGAARHGGPFPSPVNLSEARAAFLAAQKAHAAAFRKSRALLDEVARLERDMEFARHEVERLSRAQAAKRDAEKAKLAAKERAEAAAEAEQERLAAIEAVDKFWPPARKLPGPKGGLADQEERAGSAERAAGATGGGIVGLCDKA